MQVLDAERVGTDAGSVGHLDFHLRVRERGQALTEIALCLPVLCLLFLAIVEYGQMIWREMEVTTAARDGARRAVVARVEDDPTNSVIDVVRASLDTVDPNDVNVDVMGTWVQDSQMTIRVTTPHSLNVAGVVLWSGNLTAVSRTRIG